MIKTKNYFIVVCLFLFTLGCGPAKSQSKKDKKHKDEKYQEDISSYRMKYDAKKDSSADQGKKNEVIFPQKDVSKNLNAKLDSVYRKNNVRAVQGYRVLVYNGKNQSEVKNIKTQIYQIMPDADIYIDYKAPNQRVKVGNCLDRLEAYRLYGILKKIFPNAVIIPDQINILAQ
ncbi:MAG: hypothetical protein K2X86_06650 [Cytophagaceae bacterium]|nr:hypothetical protein [Cytophagaceae bacterium]